MTKLFSRLDALLAAPGDTQLRIVRKRIVTIMQLLGLPLATGYALLFTVQGYHQIGLVFAIYIPAVLLMLGLLIITRRVFFLDMFAALAVAIGFGAQTVLGGYLQSGMHAMYALIGPTAIVLRKGRRAGLRWAVLFVVLAVSAGIFEPRIRAAGPQIPQELSLLMAVVNMLGMSFFVFGMTLLVTEELETARERADELLLNILPAPVAEKLKQSPETIADGYNEVTVLFADIVDFTTLSADADPIEVVNMLNAVFSDFDSLAEKHGLEKIKTIGDAYMVAGGIPEPQEDHAEAVMAFAIDMLDAAEQHTAWNGEPIRLRVGINSGPVVAGVIGKHKFIYDLWGDAVNTASRMEANGVSNVIQVTEATYDRLKDQYSFEARGPIHIKGKGEMNTYLYDGAI